MERRYSLFFAIVVVLFTLLSSCSKTVVDKDVFVDSYIHSIFSRKGVPLYAVMHTAYSFTKISGISVSGASGKILLNNYSGDGFSFFSSPDTASYTTTIPAPDSYTYNVTYSSGESVSKVDATVAKSVVPVPQLNAVKNTTDIVLSWKPVAGTEAYKVRIFSEDATNKTNTLIFESDFLVPKDATSDLSIPFSLVSFSQYLSTNVSFEVSAFIFELNQDTYNAVSATRVKKYFGN
jgi:hypothetical protein